MSAPTISSNSLARARAELDTPRRAGGCAGQAHRLASRAHGALRESIDRLAGEIRDGVGTAIGEAQGGADRLAATAASRSARKSTGCATPLSRQANALPATGGADRRAAGAARCAARRRRRRRRRCPGEAGGELTRRDRPGSGGGGEPQRLRPAPALVAALVQVREAAAHAAERAREAIEAVIPEIRRQAVRRDPAGAGKA